MKNKVQIQIICNLCIQLREKVLSVKNDKPIPSLAGHTQQLSKDVELLLAAYSDMAVRNLLSDLLRVVQKLSAIFPLDFPVQQLSKTIQQSIQKLLGAYGPSKARYNQVICVGYKVKCAGDKYSGRPDDAADMIQRCKNMKYAIQSAYRLVDTMGNFNADDKILKIFMAPEFFFRGRNGAYTHEVVHGREAQPDAKPIALPKVKGIMEVMREEIDRPCYKNWLFVLGTAIAATELTETLCSVCKTKVKFVKDPNNLNKTKAVCTKDPTHPTAEYTYGAFVENVALVKKEQDTHTVTKELVSGIDYVADKSHNIKNKVRVEGNVMDVNRTVQASGYLAATNVPTKFQDERMGGCIFTIDGITVGLEVCLDHAAKRSNRSGRLEHAANIQVQLIPSAGMTVGKLRTIAGGVVFNVDGLTPHVQVIGGAMPEVNLSQPGNSNYKYSGMTWDELAPVGANLDPSQGPVLGSLGGAWKVPTNYIAPAGTGSVVAFGPYDIPQ